MKADVILVSDTSMLGAELPSLTTGLRGLAYWEIEVTGPNRDLHSGHFGGAVANPINVLCEIISKVTDKDGRITAPGFYDDVEEVPQAEREMIAHIPFDEKKYKEAIGVKELFGEKGYSTLERNSCARLSMYAAFGEDIQVKAPRQSFPRKRMRKFPADWLRIRIITRFRRCLQIISYKWLPTPYR